MTLASKSQKMKGNAPNNHILQKQRLATIMKDLEETAK